MRKILILILVSALAASSVAAAQTTVTWWSWNPDAARAAQFIEAFEASHEDIQVEYRNFEYTDYLQTLRLDLVAGGGPDVIGLQAGVMIKEYQPFLEDLTPYVTETLGENWRDGFYALGTDQLETGDKISALPWFLSAAGYIWYNKTIFDEYELEAPTTYDEWKGVSDTLRENGVTPFVQGAKDDWVNFDMFIALANEIAPGKIYQAEAGEVSWTDPDLLSAMNMWLQLFQDGIMPSDALGVAEYPDAHDNWVQGGAGMIFLGNWNNGRMSKKVYKEIQDRLGFDATYEFLPVLLPDMNGDGQPGRLFGGPDVALAINNQSSNKDAAWTFLSWMESAEAQTIMAQSLQFPAIKSVALDDSDVMFPSQAESLAAQPTQMENSVGKRELLYPELKTALGDALQDVASSTRTPEAALADVESVSKSIER